MFCNFCGKKIAPEDRVCPYCGQAQESRSGGNGFWDILTNPSAADDADPEPVRTVREPVRPMREPAPPMPTPPVPSDRRRRKTGRGILILSIITVVLLLASIALDVLFFPGLILPVLSQTFIDDVLCNGYRDWLTKILVFMGSCILFKVFLSYYRSMLLQKLKSVMCTISGTKFLTHMFQLPITFFDQRYTGDLVSRIQNNKDVDDFLAGDFAETFLNILIALFYLVVLFLYSWQMTIVGIVNVALCVAIVVLSNKTVAESSVKMQMTGGKLYGAVCAGLTITDTIKASGVEAEYSARILGHQAKNAALDQKRNFIHKCGIPKLEEEGFERCLEEFYLGQSLKDEGFIVHSEIAKKVVSGQTAATIISIAESAEEAPVQGSNTYRVIAQGCKAAGIEVASEARILSCCGAKMAVPDVARISNFTCREVVLEQKWYRQECGVLLGTLDDALVALYRKKGKSYVLYDGEKEVPITAEIAEKISPKAHSIGRALPRTRLTGKDLLRFCKKSIPKKSIVALALLGLAGTLIGILLPTLNQKIYDEYIALGDFGMVIQLCVLIGSFMLGNVFFSMVKKLTEYGVSCHVNYDLQNAVYWRIFQLPESFFRSYDSGDLAQRLGQAGSSGAQVVSQITGAGFGMVFSLFYLWRMIKYSGKLTVWALIMSLVFALLSYFLETRSLRYETLQADTSGKAVAKLYQYLGGVDKIRMAGAEERAILEYLIPFTQLAKEYTLTQELNSCKNVVACHDVQCVQHADGIGWDIYIRMELLKPLKLVLSADYQEMAVLKLGLSLCNALLACQEHHIVHRDIKPENILVSDRGEFKLGDFGIAKVSEKTATGTMTGTMGYMAPEVANRWHYGAQADIYSLGMVLYWMMNRRTLPFLPFPPAIPTAAQRQDAANRRFAGESFPPPVNGSRELKAVVMKACAFSTEERYQTARELRRDLYACYQQRRAGKNVDVSIPADTDEAVLTNEPTSGNTYSGNRSFW